MSNWHSLTSSNSLPDADPDGDLVNNWQEWLDGSDPKHPLSSRPVISSQPAGLLAVAGSRVSLGVAATGTTPQTCYWYFNHTNLIWAGTNAVFTLDAAQPSDSGFYSVVVSNLFGTVLSSNALLRVDHPPVPDASATRDAVVSANGTNARVILDGSRSSDVDNDPLQYAWFEGDTLVASGIVAVRILPLGIHAVSLVVSDGLFADTNRSTVTVLTPAQAVQRLIVMCDLRASRAQPLRATLSAALAAINRGESTPAMNQLVAFQKRTGISGYWPLPSAIAP